MTGRGGRSPLASGAVTATDERTEPARKRASRSVREWVITLIVVVILAVLIRTFLLQAYFIPSLSMYPTLKVHDWVLVQKVTYHFEPISAGEIIVFDTPPADTEAGPGIKHLIKRVVGLPGQTLRSGPNGEIFVDNHLLRQNWLTPAARANPGVGICTRNRTDCHGSTLRLPRGEYYVMGDNRGDSEDSRYWGPVARHLIVGQAFVRIWPPSRWHWFS